MAAYASLKNEFTEDEKCRNLMSWLIIPPPFMLRGILFSSFRLSVSMFVRSFIRDSVPFVELLQSFMLKFLKLGISQQPLIRKHSLLDHRYPGGSDFIP